MIQIPHDKVAVIPVFDSEETKGGIVKASVFVPKKERKIYEIVDLGRGKKLDEAEDIHRARYLVGKYKWKGYDATYRVTKIMDEEQVLDSGERCDQGVVKYIGLNVKTLRVGDYVFFSGYTGTLMDIEGEGRLIILPEKFVECVFDIDKFHEVPGLYFKSREGIYFTATYEQALNIMAQTFTLMNRTIDVKPEKPKYEDYNKEI
jgi:co-chaperonin GroES (HSP10)